MKPLAIIFLLLVIISLPLFADRILYAEGFYKLYHHHLIMYPDDSMEMIAYLEAALSTDFCNPLYAIARGIENKKQWERYRYLFNMHVNLKLVELYLILGSKFDKQVAYFYNAPWKEDNLNSLEWAERIYQKAFHYWKDALGWAVKADRMVYYELKGIEYWEDQRFRVIEGELDYRDIINHQIQRLSKVREAFEAMDENTY
ncbi:MAG: hypothetical protein JXR70_16930 [Spirochaetales bacterium]|nr:hypothetical protein [Spirochaetales bacterium]